jgi:hypothetical protein
MRIVRLLGTLLLFGLSGCMAQMEKDMTAQLQQQCAAKGQQFVKTDAQRTDNLIEAKVAVTGVCVGPDDPRYIPAK